MTNTITEDTPAKKWEAIHSELKELTARPKPWDTETLAAIEAIDDRLDEFEEEYGPCIGHCSKSGERMFDKEPNALDENGDLCRPEFACPPSAGS